ncbi:cytochrome P450 [Tumebacillus sp. DT12]|uniref:Cytochrome P450 n=1 Tax=Tumebacillus lacus TaxID=2995335 RepID=A0ABT3X673_9BACL|nr:cytochrome P450 [Tumebacillus lacus]MCX7572403.1 cytochrome P450 [Tumebacillus lacus]
MSVQKENLHNPKMLNPIREFDKQTKLDPHIWLKTMRETQPIRYDETRDGWDFFEYEDVHYILNHPEIFSSRRYPPHLMISQSLVFQDPPRHTDLRGMINKAFTPKMVADFAPRIQQKAEELLDQALAKGSLDIVDDFGARLPVAVISWMLGVEEAHQEMFLNWGLRFMQGVESTDPEELKRLQEDQKQAQAELFSYLKEKIAFFRQNPGENLLSALVHADVDGVPLNEDELLAFCSILLAGGSETTMHLFSHTARLFIEYPEIEQQLRENPSLYPTAIEEVLRFRPALPLLMRVCAQDTEVKGHQIKRGQGITAWISAANRDPKKFERPDEFVIDRSPNPHLTFGHGIHYCIGAPLARMEATIGLKELLKRYTNFAYVPGVQLEAVPSIIVNGVKSLPVVADRRV